MYHYIISFAGQTLMDDDVWHCCNDDELPNLSLNLAERVSSGSVLEVYTLPVSGEKRQFPLYVAVGRIMNNFYSGNDRTDS